MLQRGKRWLIILCLGLLGWGCSTQRSHISETTPEEIHRDQVLVEELTQKFESKVSFKRDTEVTVYLRKLAQKLADHTQGLKGIPVGIFLVHDVHGRWNSFSLPGIRIYLSTSLLKTLQYENEIAGLISIQFGHLLKGHLIARIKGAMNGDSKHFSGLPEHYSSLPLGTALAQPSFQSLDYFGANGVFAFSEADETIAARVAVGVMYRAGYDSRGIISIYERFKSNPRHSPFEMSAANKILEQTRQEVSLFAPLRNPIVRTQEFLTVQKRIRSL